MSENQTNLQTILDEIKNLSPDITHTFIFKADGETLAATKNTTPDQTLSLIASLNTITQAQSIGGIETLQIQDLNSQLCLTAVGDVYLGTVSSRTADQKIIKSLTGVVVPTFIQLTLGMPTVRLVSPQAVQPTQDQEDETLPEPKQLQTETAPAAESTPKPLLPKAPTTQFMVEKIGGLLVAADTVRIDSEIIEKWQELYGDKPFSHLNIETLEGKTTVCKFKPLKDAKTNAKGMIQMPEKIIQALETDKGKLVMVKPAID